MAVRTRKWCFTYNNPAANLEYCSWDCEFIVVGEETAPTTNTLHHQGYVRFKNPRMLSGVKTLLPQAHWEACKGSENDNITYCSKGDKIAFTSGSPETGQGKRTDLDVVDMVKQGVGMRAIVETRPSWQAFKMAQAAMTYLEPGRSWKPKVYWLYGPTGSGKSHAAHLLAGCTVNDAGCFDHNDKLWVSARDSRWFDGYDAHEFVILEDFRADWCKFEVLLRLLDKYAFRIEFKGGSRQLLARTIIVTCPWPPHELFRSCGAEDLQQLGRRIDHIVYVPDRASAFMMPGTSIGSVPVDRFTLPGRDATIVVTTPIEIAMEGSSTTSVCAQKSCTEVRGNTSADFALPLTSENGLVIIGDDTFEELITSFM